jgi:hypothetical protein
MAATDSELLVKVKSKLCYDRRSVGPSVLVPSTHPGPKTRFLLLSDSCGFFDVGRPLWWVYGCCLQFLLTFDSAVTLGSEPRGTHDHSLLSRIRHSPKLEGQVPLFMSPRNRVAQLYLQALDSIFVASYYSRCYGGDIRTRLQAGMNF